MVRPLPVPCKHRLRLRSRLPLQDRYSHAFLAHLFCELIDKGLEIECRDTPFFHHWPWAHACSAGCAIYCEQIDLCFRAVFNCHCNFNHGIGPGLECDSLETKVTETVYFFKESIFCDKSES